MAVCEVFEKVVLVVGRIDGWRNQRTLAQIVKNLLVTNLLSKISCNILSDICHFVVGFIVDLVDDFVRDSDHRVRLLSEAEQKHDHVLDLGALQVFLALVIFDLF